MSNYVFYWNTKYLQMQKLVKTTGRGTRSHKLNKWRQRLLNGEYPVWVNLAKGLNWRTRIKLSMSGSLTIVERSRIRWLKVAWFRQNSFRRRAETSHGTWTFCFRFDDTNSLGSKRGDRSVIRFWHWWQGAGRWCWSDDGPAERSLNSIRLRNITTEDNFKRNWCLCTIKSD